MVALLAVAAAALLPGAGQAAEKDYMRRSCYARCEKYRADRCSSAEDIECMRRFEREEARRDACMFSCERDFWNRHDKNYRPFKFR